MAMDETVKFLHQKKYKNIVYITPPPSTATVFEERLKSYRESVVRYYGGESVRNILEIKSFDTDEIKGALIKYLTEYHDTEVIIATGPQAVIALSAAAELGIRVPESMRLMILDNELSDTEKAAVQPYIIEQDAYNIGYEAGVALYNQIYGDQRIITKRMPAKLIGW